MSETLINTNQNQLNNDDASFVELIEQVQEGKTKLTQAIINKGGNVSNASTYDQLAQTIDNMDTSDGHGKYLMQSFYDVYSTDSVAPAKFRRGRFLPYHNAFIGITSDGYISIWQLTNSGLVALSTVNTNYTPNSDNSYGTDIGFGYNKNENHLVMYDGNPNNKKLIVMSMNWVTNELEITLNYDVQGDVTGFFGREDVSTAHWNGQGLLGVTINDDASLIVIISNPERSWNLYLNTITPDYQLGTATESIGFNQEGYEYNLGFNTGGLAHSIYYLDVENNILEGIDSFLGIFTLKIELTGTYPKIKTFKIEHPVAAGYSTTYTSFPLVFFSKHFYVHMQIKDAYNATVFLKRYGGTDTVYDSINLKLLSSTFLAKSSSGTNDLGNKFFSNISYGYLSHYTNNNKIFISILYFCVLQIDESGETPKLVLVSTNNVKSKDAFIIRPQQLFGPYGAENMMLYDTDDRTKSYTPIGSANRSYISYSYNYTNLLQLKDACVVATKFTDTKNNDNLFYIPFTLITYNDGGYRLVNEASTLTEDE